VKPRIAPNLPKERVEVRGQTVARSSRDCIVKIQIGACALLFGKRGRGPLNPPNIDRRGTHRRHSGQGRLENGAQFSHFDGVGASHQCAGTPPQPPRGRRSGEFAALAQIRKRSAKLMARDRQLCGEVPLCGQTLAARRALAKLGKERRIGVGGSGGRRAHWQHSPWLLDSYPKHPTESTILSIGCFESHAYLL
jgi:hypothetical protein